MTLLKLLALPFSLLSISATLYATEKIEVPVLDQEFVVQHIPAKGNKLMIWIAPGFADNDSSLAVARQLALKGIEAWYVDIAENLFLPDSSEIMRSLTGKYVSALIDKAHEKTGKQIIVIARSYGAIPALRGIRLWQKKYQDKKTRADFIGTILFSPELYRGVPSLGLDPLYEPIIYSTNIPIALYQGGKRGNRWQLGQLLDGLNKGGASVYVTVMAGVVGLFYKGDKAKATRETLKTIPGEMMRSSVLLEKLIVPRKPVPLVTIKDKRKHRLDSSLKPFQGNPKPYTLDLRDINGKRIVRKDYRGKVTVVNFWATWCPPCVEEIPSLNRLREVMMGKPFELISVNLAEDQQQIESFLKKVNVEFSVLMDTDGKVAAKWGVLVFPSTFVIGPDGMVKYGVNAGIYWDSKETLDIINSLYK